MKVILNSLAALKPKTGVGHHVANLSAALKTAYPDDEFTLYPGRALSQRIRSMNRPKVGRGHARKSGWRDHVRSAAKSSAKALSQLHFQAYTELYRFDLYHEPNFVPFASRLPTVVTVHDLSVLRFPQWHPVDRVQMHERYFRTALQKAVHVIVVSDAIRDEVVRGCGIAPERISTVYNGIHPTFCPQDPATVATVRAKYELPAEFFLCVGTIEPRKNLLMVMQAFTQLPATVRSQCPLVLAGPWGWRSEAERQFFDDVGCTHGIRQLGYVPDADLPALYAAATSLVYPSHYEGFGLPPIEMLATGGAVIASTDPAVREVCGKYAEFVPAADADGWHAAMLRMATDADYRKNITNGGQKHASQFTWERAAHDTMAVYRAVLASL